MQDEEEYLPLTEQTAKMSTLDNDLADKVELDVRHHQPDAEMMETDSSNRTKKQKSTSAGGGGRRRSRFRFSFTNQSSVHQEDEDDGEVNDGESARKSRLCRTHSASVINHDNLNELPSSRRRKSYSSTGLANELKAIPHTEATASTIDKVET